MKGEMPMLKINKLKKAFGEHLVLKGIDLNVEKGQVISIIGPSGSVKSTLLRCINYLEKPSEGLIEVDNQLIDIKKHQKKDILHLRQNLGMVFQGYNLFLTRQP